MPRIRPYFRSSHNYIPLILGVLFLSPVVALASQVTTSLYAEYKYDEGAGTTLTDYSGNGHNGTYVGGPTFNSSGVLLNGVNQYATTSDFVITTSGFTACFVVKLTSTSPAQVGYHAPLLFNTNASMYFGAAWTGGNSPALSNGQNYSSNYIADGKFHDICFVLDPGNTSSYYRQIYLDGVNINQTTSSAFSNLPFTFASSTIGGWISGGIFLGGTLAHTELYLTALSQSQIKQNLAYKQSLLSPRGIQLASRPHLLLFDGDSLFTEFPTLPVEQIVPYKAQVSFPSLVPINTAVGGVTTTNRTLLDTTNVNPLCGENGNLTPLIENVGTNDLYVNQTSAATVYANLVALHNAFHAAGCTTAQATILPRSSAPAGYETARQTLNSLIRSSTAWDTVVDVAADSTLGPAGSNTNTTYYSDGTHLTDAGTTIYATYVTAAINQLISPNTVSSMVATPDVTSVAVSWATNQQSSTYVNFGISAAYGSSTAETNTSPRSLSHSVSLANLIACTTYHLQAVSKDLNGMQATSSDRVITTTGCPGSASVATSTSSTITTGSGGTLTFGTTKVVVPASFTATSSSAVFLAQEIDPTAFFATASTPSSVQKIGSYVVDLKAFTDATTTLSTFAQPVTVTLAYNQSDISGVDTSSLKIYRYDSGIGWTVLSNCSVDTSVHTVSCQTSGFSDFSLFGTAATPTSAGGHPAERRSNLVAQGVIGAASTTAATRVFTKDMKVGLVDPEVMLLQQYLNAHGYILAETGPGSAGNETFKFGALTRHALSRFQADHGITPAVGYFGPLTRGYISSH